jgi:hypothetical protein
VNSITTKSEAVLVLETLSKAYFLKPYFKGIELAKDDAGIHVALHVQRSALPDEGSPKIKVVDGVRVCVVVHG